MLLTRIAASSSNFAGVIGRVEVLDVHRGDRQLVLLRRLRDLAPDRAQPHVGRRRHEVLEVAERVVADGGDALEHVAGVGERGRETGLAVEDEALRVEVVRGDEQAAAQRVRPGEEAEVAGHRQLAEAVRRAGGERVVEPHEHALEALVEVEPVLLRVERRRRILRGAADGVVVDHEDRREAAAEPDHVALHAARAADRPRRATDLGDREVVAGGLPGRNSSTWPSTSADIPTVTFGLLPTPVNTKIALRASSRRGRPAGPGSRSRSAPSAVTTPGTSADEVAVVRRQVVRALDLADPQREAERREREAEGRRHGVRRVVGVLVGDAGRGHA